MRVNILIRSVFEHTRNYVHNTLNRTHQTFKIIKQTDKKYVRVLVMSETNKNSCKQNN